MIDPTASRRRNVLALFQTWAESAVAAGAAPKGLEQAFAAHVEISPSMWSQIKSARPIGDKLARQIEQHCGKPAGWLDEERAAVGLTPGEPTMALATQIDGIRHALRSAILTRDDARETAGREH